MDKLLGIDLGTTNSCMALLEDGATMVLENSEGKRTTPSVVAFTKNGRIVGDAAKNQAAVNPANTIYSIKRFMGRKFDEVVEEAGMMPYKIVKGKKGDAAVKVEDEGRTRTLYPPEISAIILGKLKMDAEIRLGEKINRAVITVPAYFNDAQRQATKDAGTIAGLDVLRIINEPTAASIAYGLDKKDNEKIVVFDLGGGTFDISVLEIGNKEFIVKAYSGDTHLGGDDWDNCVAKWVMDDFKENTGIDLSGKPDAIHRIKTEAEKAKIALSSAQEYDLSLPFITVENGGPRHISMKLARSKLNQLCEDLFERTRRPTLICLEDAEITPSEVDELVLVGGMTRMPKVVETARSLVNKKPHQGINADEVVAIGAALQGGSIKEQIKDLRVLDITPLSLGIETVGGIFTILIERNTPVPTHESKVFSTVMDNQSEVSISVYQGERRMAVDNKLIDQSELTEIPPARRGLPKIEVAFDIDDNGILSVSATNLKTGKEQKRKIIASSGLSKKQIARMRKEAEKHAERDRKRFEEADIRNKSDDLTYQVERMFRESDESIPNELRSRLKEALSELGDLLKDSDVGAIREAHRKLYELIYSDPIKLIHSAETLLQYNDGKLQGQVKSRLEEIVNEAKIALEGSDATAVQSIMEKVVESYILALDEMVYWSEKILRESDDTIQAEIRSRLEVGVQDVKEAIRSNDNISLPSAGEELRNAYINTMMILKEKGED